MPCLLRQHQQFIQLFIPELHQHGVFGLRTYNLCYKSILNPATNIIKFFEFGLNTIPIRSLKQKQIKLASIIYDDINYVVSVEEK